MFGQDTTEQMAGWSSVISACVDRTQINLKAEFSGSFCCGIRYFSCEASQHLDVRAEAQLAAVVLLDPFKAAHARRKVQ